jgi:hypothetical protein
VLNDVAVVSPQEAWAVGYLGAEQPTASLILHWTGLQWERVGLPTVASLRGVTVVSPSEVWAVGSRGASLGAPGHPFAARWTGQRWKSVPIGISIRGWLQDVAAIPGTNRLWAVGGTNDGHALTLRWNGKAWHRVPVNLTHSSLSGIVAFPQTAWAAGMTTGSGGAHVLALRWNGARWRQVDAPRGYALAVDGVAPNALWAVGNGPSSGGGGLSSPAVFRWNGVRWHRVWLGETVGSLRDVVAPAPGVAWAVGVRSNRPPFHPLVVRLRSDGWHASTIRGVDGWLTAIDGTPQNLWATHYWMQDPHGGEPTYFDIYHRC